MTPQTVGRIEQLTTTSGNDMMFKWDVNGTPVEEPVCDCRFGLYEYEDYVGVAHQIMAMEWGLTD